MRIIKLIVLFITLYSLFSCHTVHFNDKYNIPRTVIIKVLDSNEKKQKYINSRDFISIINSAKRINVKFIPHKTVILCEEGKDIYTMYFSETNKYFQINGEGYKLSSFHSEIITRLLE